MGTPSHSLLIFWVPGWVCTHVTHITYGGRRALTCDRTFQIWVGGVTILVLVAIVVARHHLIQPNESYVNQVWTRAIVSFLAAKYSPISLHSLFLSYSPHYITDPHARPWTANANQQAGKKVNVRRHGKKEKDFTAKSSRTSANKTWRHAKQRHCCCCVV